MKKISNTRTFCLPLHKADDPSFYKDLRESLKIARITYNRTLSHIFSLDNDAFLQFATNQKIDNKKDFFKKIKDNKQLSIYKSEADLWASGTTQICASITRDATNKYWQHRFNIISGRSSLPTQRSVPFLILKNESKIWFEDNKLFIELKLISNGQTKKHKVELKSGSNFAIQINTLKKIWQNKEEYEDKLDTIGDHKVWIDKNGKVIFGLSIKIDTSTPKNKSGVLKVFSSRNSLLTCTIDKTNIPFTFNCDHLKRWQNTRKRYQKRLAQDKKFGKYNRKYIEEKQRKLGIQYKNRLRDFCHKVSKEIIEKAKRLNVEKIELDTTIKSYIEQFTWFDLEQKIKYKCDDANIGFEKVTRDVIPPQIDEPHIYCVASIGIDGNPDGKVKIGQTKNAKERKKNLECAGGQKLIYIFGDKQSKTNLTKKEKEYHSLFDAYRLKNTTSKEWFELAPIIEWTKEVGIYGNMDNMDELLQYFKEFEGSSDAKNTVTSRGS